MTLLQKIIEEMEDDVSMAKRNAETYRNGKSWIIAALYEERQKAIEKHIPKLKLLLNEQPKAITEDSHLRKRSVGQSAASEDISEKGNAHSESSSETSIVGQNEEAKKHCDLFADGLDYIGQYCDCKAAQCKYLENRIAMNPSASDK